MAIAGYYDKDYMGMLMPETVGRLCHKTNKRKNKRMKVINATIKNAEIRTSERFSDAVDIILEIITEERATVNLIITGNCRKDSDKNEIGYSVSRIMDICEVDSFLEVEDSPIRAIFENERLIGICGFFDKENKFIPSEEL